MNWPGLLRNQWFQLCLVAALCSAGAGIFDLATNSGIPPPPPPPSPTPQPTAVPTPMFTKLHAKKPAHWLVDASGAADADSGDLAQVLNSIDKGDTVTIRPGKYEAALVIQVDVALVGEGNLSTYPEIFFGGDTYNVINCQAGHLSLSNLRIEQNSTAQPASLYCGNQSQVVMNNCFVTSRGLHNVSVEDDARLDARDCRFKSSEIGFGLVYLGRSQGTVTHCTILGNKWGLDILNQARVTVDNCTFQENGTQKGEGFAICVSGGGAIANVQSSHFLGNSGSAAYTDEGGNLTMTGCNLENNGITLEGDHVTAGLVCVQTGAKATVANSVCKSNKQGIAVLAAGKLQLTDVSLSMTGIDTGNTQYGLFCNTIFLQGEGTTASISGCTISDSENNGLIVMSGAKAIVNSCSVNNSRLHGMVFGGDDGTPGYGTVIDTKELGNHVDGIFLQSRSAVEVNAGEISNNQGNGVEVNGTGSRASLAKVSVLGQGGAGLMAYSGGSITGKESFIEKNRFGIQAGLPGNDPATGGTINLQSSHVQYNSDYGASSYIGSTITLLRNTFKNGKDRDYFNGGGTFTDAGR
jgi:hypothetical protein